MPMDSSTAQSHHQEMGSESMLVCTKAEQEKKAIRGGEQGLINCPRCESTNTKFCYYNNYSLSQPRYFCKSCTRYWTKGGTLRNVPVGGGCRKNNKRPSSPSKRSRDHQPITTIPSPILCFNPFSYDSSDLSQAIARIQKQTAGHLGLDDHHDFSISGINPNTPLGINSCAGLLDALRGGILEIPRGFHDLYDGINLGMGNGGMGFEEHSNATTASGSVGREGEGNGGLGGSPWQGIIGGDGQMGDLESIRLGSWNGIASSNWY